MSNNNLLVVIALTIISIGCLVAFSLTTTTVAEIEYGDWAKIEQADGTLSYSPLPNRSPDQNKGKQLPLYSDESGLQVERVTGYAVRISKTHKMWKKISTDKLHLFDTEEAALRYVKENGIPDKRITKQMP